MSCPKNWVACDQKMLPFLALRASFAAPWDEFFFRKMYHANIITDFYGETEQLHALDCSMHLELCHCARSRAADNKRKKGNYKSLPWIGKLLRQLYWKIHYLSCLVYFPLCLIITSFRVEWLRKIIICTWQLANLNIPRFLVHVYLIFEANFQSNQVTIQSF